MAQNEEPGDRYWTLIESAFDIVNIHDGPAVVAEQFAKLPPEVGHLLAAHWCQSEVVNGGLYQFFSNSAAVLAPEALAGFKAIGLTEWATLLGTAMSVLGNSYPRHKAQRQRALPNPKKGSPRSGWDPFYDLDKRFYEPLKRAEFMWEEAADAYAARHWNLRPS